MAGSARRQRPTFLDSLPEADRAALLALGRHSEWERSDRLFHAGDRADSAVVILDGLVKVHKLSSDGADVVLALVGAGDLLGEISAVRDAERSATATALEAVDAAVIPVPELRDFLSRHHASTLALLELALSRLAASDARRLEFATSGSLARVSSRLTELAVRFGEAADDGTIAVPLPMSQDDLASWSASSRESTARALRSLRELGLIRTPGSA